MTAPLSPEERDALPKKLDAALLMLFANPRDMTRYVAAEHEVRELYKVLLADHARLTVALQAATEDSALLDRLEAEVMKEELMLHDGMYPIRRKMPCRGLGFGPALNRTLRDAIRGLPKARSLPTEDTKR